MKVSKSGLYLLLAALLIVGSIPVATLGLTSTDIPMAIGRVAIGALLVLCGVFMVATVMRSRLIIEGSHIRFRIVFREEVFNLSAIEGIRTITTGPTSRPVVCVRGQSKPIEIVQFDPDDFLQTWLQQLPKLDEPPRDDTSQPNSEVRQEGLKIDCSVNERNGDISPDT